MMRTRQTSNLMMLPPVWLMTDPRLGNDLPGVVARLPDGAGVIFRHYQLAARARRALFMAVRAVCRRQGRLLLLAGTPRQAQAWGADGFHGKQGRRLYPGQWHSAPAHDVVEIVAADRAGADWVLVSPVFATRSHPGAVGLGRVRFGQLCQRSRLPVYALGGVTADNVPGLAAFGIAGWAAIDGLASGL